MKYSQINEIGYQERGRQMAKADDALARKESTANFKKLEKSMDGVRTAMWQLIRDAKAAKATGFRKQAIKVEAEIAKLHHTLSSQK